MYSKLPFGMLLALLGIVALPDTTMAGQVSRLLLQITGAGFGLYLLGVFALVMAMFGLRLKDGRHR